MSEWESDRERRLSGRCRDRSKTVPDLKKVTF